MTFENLILSENFKLNTVNTIHILAKTSVMVSTTFRVSGSGIKGSISFPFNGSVMSLKEEIFNRFQPQKVVAPEGMKLILKGNTLSSDELIGEYTGTMAPHKPQHLLVMLNPVELSKKTIHKDVNIQVELPNQQTVKFEVKPSTLFIGVKVFFNTHTDTE